MLDCTVPELIKYAYGLYGKIFTVITYFSLVQTHDIKYNSGYQITLPGRFYNFSSIYFRHNYCYNYKTTMPFPMLWTPVNSSQTDFDWLKLVVLTDFGS